MGLVLCGAVLGGGYFFLVHLPEKEAEALYQEGLGHEQEDRPAAALAAYEAAFRKHPAHPEAGFAVVDAIVFFDREKATEVLNRLERKEQPAERILSRRITLALQEDQVEKAERLAVELEEHEPLGREGAFARLHLLLKTDEVEAGLGLLDELVNVYPSDRRIRLLQAQVLYATGSMVNRVRAKTLLLDLLERVDVLSFRSAVMVGLMEGLPLFEADLSQIAAHLENHPLLEAGTAQLELPELRSLALNFAQTEPGTAFLLGRYLADREEATERDRSFVLMVAQRSGRVSEVEDLIADLAAKETPTLSEELILARQDFLEGKTTAGIGRLRKVLEEAPENTRAMRLLVDRLAQPDGEMEAGDQLQICELLLEHPEAGPDILLRVYQLRISLEPDRREALIAEAVERLAGEHPLQTAFWLVANDDAGRALELVSDDEAGKDLNAFSARYQALAALGRYTDGEAMVKRHAALLSPFQRSLARARLALLEGDREKARIHVAGTLESVQTPDEKSGLFELAAMAGEIGAASLQRDAYAAAFEGGLIFSTFDALSYLELLLKEKSAARAKAFTAYMRNLEPENPLYINNDCYLGILLDEDLQASVAEMSQLVEAHPERSHFRVTLALGQLLEGDGEKARATLDSSEVSLDLDSPRGKFAFALVLAGSGNRGMAHNVVASIERSDLMREEQQLLERFLFDSENR